MQNKHTPQKESVLKILELLAVRIFYQSIKILAGNCRSSDSLTQLRATLGEVNFG